MRCRGVLPYCVRTVCGANPGRSSGYLCHYHREAAAPLVVGASMAALCMLIALHPLGQALRISTLRASLSGKAMQVITTRRLVELNGNEEQALLGAGFE